MAAPPPACPSHGGLMELLHAMDKRRVPCPSGSVDIVAAQDDVPFQGPAPFQPTENVETGAPVQPNVPVHDDVPVHDQAPHHVDPSEGFNTPKKNQVSLTSSSWFVPHCEEERLKPVVGMLFDTLDEVEELYKTYAHASGFSVRIGAQAKKSDVVANKRFVCSRAGFTKRHVEPNKQKKHSETRCGCNARIYVRLGQDNRYYIASFVEEHNHGPVSIT